MGYYLRLFSKDGDPISIETLGEMTDGKCTCERVSGTKKDWKQVILRTRDGLDICDLERDCANKLFHAEIEEFIERLEDTYPRLAADWVRAYLKDCQVVYSFQILGAALNEEENFGVIRSVIWELQSCIGGILQADGEGFSNEEGDHITWDFSDNVFGPWQMAVLVNGDRWQKFQMDLGNRLHRAAFIEGRVPDGVQSEPIN